ncbi:hypothetical protein PPYR_13238 [Photinus pyralis]|uniref:Uncharacterized protein n=1 Tax=Photinus pyralis TaxID=7054 RepID=A0A5N4A8N3_PHOPY|nr:hypothetical protein PPYR_13238 [Photinus pyralis]
MCALNLCLFVCTDKERALSVRGRYKKFAPAKNSHRLPINLLRQISSLLSWTLQDKVNARVESNGFAVFIDLSVEADVHSNKIPQEYLRLSNPRLSSQMH